MFKKIALRRDKQVAVSAAVVVLLAAAAAWAVPAETPSSGIRQVGETEFFNFHRLMILQDGTIIQDEKKPFAQRIGDTLVITDYWHTSNLAGNFGAEVTIDNNTITIEYSMAIGMATAIGEYYAVSKFIGDFPNTLTIKTIFTEERGGTVCHALYGDDTGCHPTPLVETVINTADGEIFNAPTSVRPRANAASRGSSAFVSVRGKTLTVRPSSPDAVSRVRLIDIRGKSVASFTARGNANFTLAKVPAGRYFAEVRGSGVGRQTLSVVVK